MKHDLEIFGFTSSTSSSTPTHTANHPVFKTCLPTAAPSHCCNRDQDGFFQVNAVFTECKMCDGSLADLVACGLYEMKRNEVCDLLTRDVSLLNAAPFCFDVAKTRAQSILEDDVLRTNGLTRANRQPAVSTNSHRAVSSQAHRDRLAKAPFLQFKPAGILGFQGRIAKQATQAPHSVAHKISPSTKLRYDANWCGPENFYVPTQMGVARAAFVCVWSC